MVKNLEKEKNFKSNFIWNIVGTGFNAFNSLFFLVAVTRINGVNDAGIFTIAYSTACILYVIGVYAGRVFQVTETNKNINNKEFILNRILSCVLMIGCTLIFVLFKHYDNYKSIIFIFLAFSKCLEAFSDVLYGILQKNNQLNIVGKSYFYKAILSVVLFVVVDIYTQNVIISISMIILVWILMIIFYDFRHIKNLLDKKENISIKKSFLIFKNGFFIFIISFLGLYLINAPKYAIDNYLANDLQTIFGIIVMPATIMGLVGQFLLHPYLTTIVELYKENKINQLNKLIFKIVKYIVYFGIVASILAYLIGIPVLNLIYGIDISAYRIHLVFIIISSTLYNIGIIYSTLLTTIRKTFIQFVIYGLISIIALIISDILTKMLKIDGSVIAYFIIMFLYYALYFIIIKIIFNKIKLKGEMSNGTTKSLSDNTSI